MPEASSCRRKCTASRASTLATEAAHSQAGVDPNTQSGRLGPDGPLQTSLAVLVLLAHEWIQPTLLTAQPRTVILTLGRPCPEHACVALDDPARGARADAIQRAARVQERVPGVVAGRGCISLHVTIVASKPIEPALLHTC